MRRQWDEAPETQTLFRILAESLHACRYLKSLQTLNTEHAFGQLFEAPAKHSTEHACVHETHERNITPRTRAHMRLVSASQHRAQHNTEHACVQLFEAPAKPLLQIPLALPLLLLLLRTAMATATATPTYCNVLLRLLLLQFPLVLPLLLLLLLKLTGTPTRTAMYVARSCNVARAPRPLQRPVSRSAVPWLGAAAARSRPSSPPRLKPFLWDAARGPSRSPRTSRQAPSGACSRFTCP